ncbi:MAG: DNA ligase D [Burkholderiales bacterium]|nr:DNA ligase D [Bacteroidia bacterium]
MGLLVYNKKRDFKSTPEPSGGLTKSKSKLAFVIQRHKASHLHYDFRLEIDGVLKSWAVPKGPSLNSKDKRLAMMVEDHPYNYKSFAGIIPEGNYGAGIVEIWDEGEFSDLENSDKKTAEKKLKAGIQSGSIKFKLYGKKLKGEFALIKLKGKQENAWLLIKHNDEYAVNEEYNSEEYTLKSSPINQWLSKNGKSVPAIKVKAAQKKSDPLEVKQSIKKKNTRFLPGKTSKLSEYIRPMLAKGTDKPFDDKEWIYEIKWDGYRAIAEVNEKEVSLYSRNGNTFNYSYPIIVDALKKLNIHAVLDGEVVVMDENGKSSFQGLQYYENNTTDPIEFRVFDFLSLKGQDVCSLTLRNRKKLLKLLLPTNNPVIKYSDHIEEQGIEFFNLAVKNDLEGIMAKDANSIYFPGVRTSQWLKIKNHKTLEAIITGFTEPTGGRKHFGALVLGVWREKELVYIGHTGSGFDTNDLEKLSKLMKPLIQKKSPIKTKVKTNMTVTWIKPLLVCEIKYTEWTRDGHLRHPVFLRLREDKKSKEVTTKDVKIIKPEKTVKTKPALKKKTVVKPKKELENGGDTISFGRIKVKTTNLNKVFWPNEKITKGDVINYYQSISKYILPYLKDRPESLKRNPNGIKDSGFFHKDAGVEAPDWVKSQSIFSESTNKDVNYILCNNAATLAYLNNLGCIEINPWHSTIQKLDKPDYLIIDIDPSEKNTFEQVIETANVVQSVFKRAGVISYCKTSAATGIHVYVPTKKKYTYDQLKDFAHLVCILVQEELPKFTSLERNLKKRGNKMIYLDHLQNRRGQTISSVYSLRPANGATVSMPLSWNEVKPGLSPNDFNIYNALKRIEKKGDLFAPILGKGIDLLKCLKLLDR